MYIMKTRTRSVKGFVYGGKRSRTARRMKAFVYGGKSRRTRRTKSRAKTMRGFIY